MKRHERRSKQRRRRERLSALERVRGKENEKNGKCCTNSDIKLIFFIMHQSSVLARAYFMQKQVLAFRSLLYFRDIYSDYTLFHGFVSLNSCLQAGHSSRKKSKSKSKLTIQKTTLPISDTCTDMAGRQAGQPHLSLQRALNKSLRNEITVGTLHLLSPFLPYKILNVFGVVVCFVSQQQQNSEGQQIFVPSSLHLLEIRVLCCCCTGGREVTESF